jgi:hypothetical protein
MGTPCALPTPEAILARIRQAAGRAP